MAEIFYGTVYALLTATAVFFAWKLMRVYQKFSDKAPGGTRTTDLPSVSICIPARNETHAMTQCLERVVASTYPKVEIIVLDDSSVDDTSILIKSFAHAGVRFVEGSGLPEDWLGKNHALEGLLREASGSYILFMDVDTQITPDTVAKLVTYARRENAEMVSVLPRRNDGWRMSVVWATLRYFWELVFHTSRSPAVASNAWLIRRRTLRDELGGFTAFRREVQPEARIATYLAATGRYRFLISTQELGISYEKKWLSQAETSIRLLLPKVGGTTIRGIGAIVALLLLNLPTSLLIAGLMIDWQSVQFVSLWFMLIYSAIYGSYVYRVWNKGWWLGALLWPVLLLQETVLMILSIVRYATHRVTWKGRPVALVKRVPKTELSTQL